MMRLPWKRALLLAAACLLPGPRAAAAEAAPVVIGFNRFYADEKADAVKGGQLLLTELNCVSCHATTDPQLTRKQAPVLDHVAGRVRVSYLKKFLSDPHAAKPGTTMPDVLAGDPDRDAHVEALVHFLASTGAVKQQRPDPKSVPLGRDLYGKVGCVACHGPRDDKGLALKTESVVVPLGDLSAKYTVPSLAAFLENPRHVRPSGRMPQTVKDGKDAKDVASYLLQGVKVDFNGTKGGTRYAYYEGHWDKLPDFDKLKPAASGDCAAFSLGVAKRNENYAVKFDGFFKVDADGEYKFSLNSDDGSKLYVDGQQVVDNDGVHAPKAATGKVKLTKGVHKVTVAFFQVGGGAELDVHIELPGAGAQDFANLVAVSEAALEKQVPQPKKDDVDFLEIKPQLVEQGKALFGTAGCANCHQLTVDKKPLAPSLKANGLDKIKAEGGCLAAAPAKGLPRYALSERQRASLAAAITKQAPLSKEPVAVIERTLTTFNCYACHMRGETGGVDLEGDLNKLFQTTQPEMGDEGRLPPPLTGVGAKLTPEYMKKILESGAHDRPYMHTRMPAFGLANVGALAEAFAAADKLPAIEEVKFAETPAKVRAAARHLVGTQAIGCVKCHTFNGEKAEGVQGIDMTLMPQRLQRDWFHAYLLTPARLRPGTRMPEAWPGGKTFYKDVLEGKTLNQIEAIWVYLKDGKSAQPPIGIGKKSIPLVPDKGAIIYRNFIKGNTRSYTRAVAVGYPEKAHLAFDANEMHLALIWQGAFLDAGRHWTDRGEGFQGPLGDNVLELHAGAPFAVLAKPDEAWPVKAPKEMGYKFGGYRLADDDRPTFLYSFDDVKVEDFPNAVAAANGKEPSLKRTLKLTSAKAVDNLYLRAAVGTKIESAGDGWYKIDGWKMKLDGGATPQIRQSAGKAELLVPVPFKDGKAQVIQEFAW